MDNRNIFDELTNRLSKAKRPDSGIHNSGEFIGGQNERNDKSDEQADSGQESDPTEAADGSAVAKRSGILKNFRKMFKIKRKSKTGKINQHNDDPVISAQYRAVSEPDIISSSSKEVSNENNFTSDDDERVDDKKVDSPLKDGPSFMRLSLRKLKLRRSKERKTSGGTTDVASAQGTPKSTERDNVEPFLPPTKSPKETHNKGFNVNANKSVPSDEIIPKKQISVDMDGTTISCQPIIQSTAAKDRIRIAPTGRKKPTRTRPRASTDGADKKSSISQRSGDVVDGSKDVKSAIGLPKKHDKDVVDKKENLAEISAIEETFDSFITSLETIGIPDTSTPKKSASPLVKPKIPPKSDLKTGELKQKSRENIENVNISKSIDDVPAQNDTARGSSVQKFEIGYIPLKDNDDNTPRRPISVSLADIMKSSSHVSPMVRRSKSFKAEKDVSCNMDDYLSNSNIEDDLPNTIVPLKDESTESSRRYNRFRKQRSQTSPSPCENFQQTVFSKSMEDVSRVNKENRRHRQSGNLNDDVTARMPNLDGPLSNNNPRRGSHSSLKQTDECKSVENLKKSSSRRSLSEKSSLKQTDDDPIISYTGSSNNKCSNYSPDKPRKLQKKLKRESKDDMDAKAQSVTVRSCDVNVNFPKVSPARSYGDIRSQAELPVSKKDKQLVHTGKSISVDSESIRTNINNNKDICNNVDDTVLEFKRMSLKKIEKTEDYFAKEPSGDIVGSNDVIEKKHALKHIETRNVDLYGTGDDKTERCRDEVISRENKVLVDRDEQLQSPVNNVEIKPPAVDLVTSLEVNGSKEESPEFHRIALRQVEKRDDYLEKECEQASPDPIKHTGSSFELKEVVASPVTPTSSESQDVYEKNKFVVKSNVFPFQSNDIKTSDNKAQQDNTTGRPKSIPFSQTSKMPHFRRSIDIQENPNPHGVPAWIALARERQREEATTMEENVVDEVFKESDAPTNDVKIESLVKPSAFKSKPTPLPKQPTSSVTTTTTTSDTSQLASPNTKKPPPISQRPRFNAKTDLPKDACMVCGKIAYIFERCEVNKRTLHRACAKCHVCSRTLNLVDIFINDGKVWCKQHR